MTERLIVSHSRITTLVLAISAAWAVDFALSEEDENLELRGVEVKKAPQQQRIDFLYEARKHHLYVPGRGYADELDKEVLDSLGLYAVTVEVIKYFPTDTEKRGQDGKSADDRGGDRADRLAGDGEGTGTSAGKAPQRAEGGASEGGGAEHDGPGEDSIPTSDR